MKFPSLRFLKAAFLSIAAVLVVAVIIPETASAQLQFQQVIPDASKLPLVSARIKALKAGDGLTLTNQNLFIIEDNRYTRAASISAPDGNGFQTVEWYSQLRSSMEVKLILSDGAELAETKFNIPSLPFLGFFQFQGKEKRIIEYKFGTVSAGSSATTTARIKIMNSDSAARRGPLRLEKI